MEKGDKVAATEFLLRRVFFKDKKYVVKPDGIPTSRAFSPRAVDEGKLSVDVESLTTYEKAISDIDRFRLYKLSAQVPYTLGLSCIHDPDLDRDNPAHALIQFEDNLDEMAAQLAKKAQKVPYPDEW